MKQDIIMVILLLGMAACHKPSDSQHKVPYETLPNVTRWCKSTVVPLILDTFCIVAKNENEMTSLRGEYFIQKDTLYFADRQLASVFCYDLEGRFLCSHLSRGRGPKEILDLDVITFSDKNYFILDAQWNFYALDKQWTKIDSKRIDWQAKHSYKYLYDHPGPDEQGIYEVEYTSNRLRLWKNDLLVFPIVTEHVKYNAYGGEHARHFYENSYTLGILDNKEFKLVKMMCNRSPIYRNYQYLPNFKHVIFDTPGDTLYYSFEIDSLIYQMSDTNSLAVSFGQAGQKMNTNYPERLSLEEADKHAGKDRRQYGFYYDLKYIPETALLFRSYHLGSPYRHDGLQVYKNQQLIAEFQVPENFRVIGFVSPYYYAAGQSDVEKESMIVYRFQFNE